MSGSDSIPRREFPVTHWTMIGDAASTSRPAGFKALETVLERYAPCMKAHLVYMKRMPPDRADDLVQGFITDKVLQGDLLQQADRARGKFRTFLLSSLERYVISQIRKEQAARRSPGPEGHVPIDDVAERIEAPAGSSPAYDVAWARSILNQTLERVRMGCEAKQLSSHWRLFEARVVKPLLEGAEVPPYEVLAKTLGFASPMQASNALITTKRMFGRKLREVVLDYAGSEDEVEKEIADLRAVLAGISA